MSVTRARRRAPGPILSSLAAALGLAACGGEAPPVRVESASAGEVVATPPAPAPACAPDNAGLTLPAGFCATLFADSVGGARHLTVAPNGDVFVALSLPRRRAGGPNTTAGRGGVLALRDRDGDGRADEQQAFGGRGGSGIAFAPGVLYVDEGTAIVRYAIPAGQLRPTGAGDSIVTGLPMGGHSTKSLVLDGRGGLFVTVGSASNSCQEKDRGNGSPGTEPCVELATRAGIWRYRADRTGQVHTTAARYATGIRNAVAVTLAPDGQLWAAQHGRDQLFQNWGDRFTAEQSADLPAEELFPVREGDDLGWPYCYFDQNQGKLVLAPEYGGDGRQVGRCAQKKAPAASFPAHWAPMSALFYTGRQFPARYRSGAFVAFHGSWNRAPLPQGGYQIAFVPLRGGRAAGPHETFADGFAGGAARLQPGQAQHRPVGMAMAPDGGVYVTDDSRGRIWKIVYRGK